MHVLDKNIICFLVHDIGTPNMHLVSENILWHACKAISIEASLNDKQTFSIESLELREMFTPMFYYPFYIETIREMKKKFETVKLDSQAIPIKRGVEVGSKEYKRYLQKQEDDVPFVRTSDIVNYTIDDFPDYYVRRQLLDFYRQDLLENDILFANDGKIGASAMIVKGDECIFQSHLRRVRLLEGTLNPEFVFAFLNTTFALFQIYRRIYIQSTISTIGHGLSQLEIPLLNSRVESKVTDYVRRAMKLEVERKALMRKARDKVDNLLG